MIALITVSLDSLLLAGSIQDWLYSSGRRAAQPGESLA
jgi:hypothetical protein